MIQKSPRWESRRLLDMANGMACQHCGCEDGTTVMAHSNSHLHGKGGARKADDLFVAAVCFGCHTWIDTGRGNDPTGVWKDSEKDEVWRRAHDKTMLALFRAGKLRVV